MTRWGSRLPWGAALVFVALALGWLSSDVRVPREAFRDYSIYNQAAGGLSLAYRFLEASGRTVKPLARPVLRDSDISISCDRDGLCAAAITQSH